MTAAVRIELDAEQLEELAERIAAKMRAPRVRTRPAKAPLPKPSEAEIEQMRRLRSRRSQVRIL